MLKRDVKGSQDLGLPGHFEPNDLVQVLYNESAQKLLGRGNDPAGASAWFGSCRAECRKASVSINSWLLN